MRDGHVRLYRSSTSPLNVSIGDLSADDRQYVHGLLRIDPQSKIFVGKVIAVGGGDRITVVDEEQNEHRIQLKGVDLAKSVPEAAKQALSSKVVGKFPWIEWRETDKDGTALGQVYLDGRHINLEMVAEGHASHSKRFGNDSRLANAELVARHLRLGIWSDSRTMPR